MASGLLAVAFSLASLVNVLMEAALGRSQPRLSHLFAALIGIMGVALLYWPELVFRRLLFRSLDVFRWDFVFLQREYDFRQNSAKVFK